MANFICKCPKCSVELQIENPHKPVACSACGLVFTAKSDGKTEAGELFLSGSSYLVLREYKNAAELFLEAAKLVPSNAKYWLYLLCAITERFKTLLPIARDGAAYALNKRKVVYKSVYKNFIACATDADYAFAASEFNMDFSPSSGDVWVKILDELLACPIGRLSSADAAGAAHYATLKLLSSNPQAAKSYFPALCKRLNPLHDGVLEINSLMYYPESRDGVLRLDTDAHSIEFESDKMLGCERFNAFLLTENITNIGAAFPFEELVVDGGVTEIPDSMMCYCVKIRSVRLSKTVKRIGKSAFEGCVNLSSVAPLSDVTEIDDRAFYGTSVRTLDLPSSVERLGAEVLGAKKGEDVPLEKYLIELEYELARASAEFNRVGEHTCGYVTRKNGKFSLNYPQKTVGGKKTALDANEKRIFEALACVSMENTDDEAREPTFGQKMKSLAVSIKDKFKKQGK